MVGNLLLIEVDRRFIVGPPRSLVIRASARGAEGRDYTLRLHTKDVKTGRFALLSLAHGTNELGNRLAGSEPV